MERSAQAGSAPVKSTLIIRMWTVFHDPLDYPGKFVVRGIEVHRGQEPVPDRKPLIVCDSIEAARKVIPEGAYRLGRMPDDEPQIVEVWL